MFSSCCCLQADLTDNLSHCSVHCCYLYLRDYCATNIKELENYGSTKPSVVCRLIEISTQA